MNKEERQYVNRMITKIKHNMDMYTYCIEKHNNDEDYDEHEEIGFLIEDLSSEELAAMIQVLDQTLRDSDYLLDDPHEYILLEAANTELDERGY